MSSHTSRMVPLRIVAALLFVGAGVAGIVRMWMRLAHVPAHKAVLAIFVSLLTAFYVWIVWILVRDIALRPRVDEVVPRLLTRPTRRALALLGAALILAALAGPLIQFTLAESLFVAGFGAACFVAAGMWRPDSTQRGA